MMDWMTKQAMENLPNATPLTREGMAKGVATTAAELRGGLLDLQRAVVHAFPDSRQQETVLGMIGVPTPLMVDKEQEAVRKSVLGYDLAKPEQGDEQQREQSRGI